MGFISVLIRRAAAMRRGSTFKKKQLAAPVKFYFEFALRPWQSPLHPVDKAAMAKNSQRPEDRRSDAPGKRAPLIKGDPSGDHPSPFRKQLPDPRNVHFEFSPALQAKKR